MVQSSGFFRFLWTLLKCLLRGIHQNSSESTIIRLLPFKPNLIKRTRADKAIFLPPVKSRFFYCNEVRYRPWSYFIGQFWKSSKKRFWDLWSPTGAIKNFFFLISIKCMFTDRIECADYEYQYYKVHKFFISKKNLNIRRWPL